MQGTAKAVGIPGAIESGTSSQPADPAPDAVPGNDVVPAPAARPDHGADNCDLHHLSHVISYFKNFIKNYCIYYHTYFYFIQQMKTVRHHKFYVT